VLAQPAQRRPHEPGNWRAGGVLGQIGGVKVGEQGRRLRPAACVCPDDRRADRLASRVEADRAVHLPGEADTAHGLAVNARPRECVAACRHCRLEPVAGVLLGPTGARCVQRDLAPGGGQHACRLRLDDGGFHAGSSDVDAQESAHVVLRSGESPQMAQIS